MQMTRGGRRGEAPQSVSPGGRGPQLELDTAEQIAEPDTVMLGAGRESEGKGPSMPGIKGDASVPRIKPDSVAEASSGASAFSTGRHFIYVCGEPRIPMGARVVPPSGPNWPWCKDPEAFDRVFAQMTEHGLTGARIDLLWAIVEPERGRLGEAHLAVLDRAFDATRAHGIMLHLTLFMGGEVGDAY